MVQEEPDENLTPCHECGVKLEDGNVVADNTYCDACFDSTFTLCRGCEEFHVTTAMHSDGNIHICSDCRWNHYIICERCGSFDTNEDCQYVDGSYWCGTCAEYYSTYCDECDTNHQGDCPNDEHCNIHNYSYKPMPRFGFLSGKGDPIVSGREQNPHYSQSGERKVFMGFEVEVESYHSTRSAGADVFDSSEDFMYLKEDGSLDDGFEVVSHPSTLAYYDNMRDKFFTPFTRLSELGFRAWRTTTCGMHVHISRLAFTNKAHLWRFAFFMNCNPDVLQRFAGRRSDNWASFDGQKEIASKIIAGKSKYGPERYTAVNLCNYNTVEIRIFRSSLLPRRIMANLGLVDCAVEFTRDLTVKQVNDHEDSWARFVEFVLSRTEPQYEDVQYYIRKYFASDDSSDESDD